MKVLPDIPDHKVASWIEAFGGISYLKAQTLTPYRAQVLEDLKEGVEQVKLAKQGKVKLKPARKLLNEL